MSYNIYQFIICFLLIILTALFIKIKKIGIEKDILLSFFRASGQVIILSFIILKLFTLSNFYTFLALTFMAIAGTFTASKHGKFLKNSFYITFLGIFIASFSIILLMIILKGIENKAEIIIPLGGMVIGNSMNSIALAFDRLNREIKENKNLIETILSLGFSSQVAYSKIKMPSLKVAMIPKINNLRSLGLVWIPGLMAGMIIGGASPVKAAVYQLIIMAMIISSSFLSTFIVLKLARKKIFNEYEQLIIA